MVVAVYPGTFDPLTRGHEDLVRRASGLFDTLVVGVADSKNKKPFFSLDERLEIANEVLGHYPNVKVESFSGLLKDFVRQHDARVIVRGLRADALAVARDLAQRGQRFDLIFLDPPYQQDFLSQTLPLCTGLLKEGGLVYAESSAALPFAEAGAEADSTPEWLQPWQLVRGDKAGMVHFHLLKLH